MLPLKAAFVLLALIKTPGEGGTVQMPFDTLSACEATGAQIEQTFEVKKIGKDLSPEVVWACVAPAQ